MRSWHGNKTPLGSWHTPQRGGGGGPATKIHLVVVIGASNQAGGDDGGVLTAADSDATGRIRQFRWTDGTLQNLAGTIHRPGGEETTKTSPGIEFAKAFAATLPAEDKVVMVMSAVGGRGVVAGATDSTLSGPWDAAGTGAAYVVGGTPATTSISGAMFKAQGAIRTAVYAACEAEVGAGNVIAPIFYGCPMNENDIGGPFDRLRSRAEAAITGIRSAWGAVSAAWVMPGTVPEWSYTGSANTRLKMDAVYRELEERLAYCAYVTGEVGFMNVSENIHYTNAGLRLLGTRAFAAVAVATGRAVPAAGPLDWLTGGADRFAWGFYRSVAAYGTGAAFRMHNGTTEIDINFTADGNPDWAAMMTHAGWSDGVLTGAGNCYVTRMYDQAGSGTWLIPEGTQAAGAAVMTGGNPLFQGRKLAWGNNLNLIMLKDSTYVPKAAGAVLAIGRLASAGNKTLVGGPASTLSMYRASGNLLFRIGATLYGTTRVPTPEPAWASANSMNSYAHFIGGTDMRTNGVLEAVGTAGTGPTVSAQIGWGGSVGSTNRYAASTYTQLVAWDVAPTGADLAAVDIAAASFCRV